MEPKVLLRIYYLTPENLGEKLATTRRFTSMERCMNWLRGMNQDALSRYKCTITRNEVTVDYPRCS